MRITCLLLAGLLLPVAAGTCADESIPAIKLGTPYAEARGTLIAKGFQPVRSGERDDGRCSAGRQDVCVAYPETISCSGTGDAPCRFIFSAKGGTTVTLVADGEDAGHLKVAAFRRSAEKDAEWQRKSR